MTDAFYRDGKKFCKAAAMNEATQKLSLEDWVLYIDADMILPQQSRDWLESAELDPHTIYSVDRLMCKSYREWLNYLYFIQREKLCPSDDRAYKLPLGVRQIHPFFAPIGFFQLWNPKGAGLHKMPLHDNAGWSDYYFGLQWARARRAIIPEIMAIHLDSEDTVNAVNWTGRKSKRFGPENESAKKDVDADYSESAT